MRENRGKAQILSIGIIFSCLIMAQNLYGQVNKYQEAGFQLLDNLNTRFYNSGTGLYVESINSSTLAKSGPAFLWPAAHMIRALLWGAMIDPKYDARLLSYSNKMTWYINGEGYGCIQNGERFFDDNGLIGDVLMDVYQLKSRTQPILDKSMFALRYCYKYKDAQWGLPQKESELNKGIFYMGPVDPLSNAYAKYYTITGDTNYLHVAKTYFTKFNDYTLRLKNPTTLLFVSGSTYANGVWTPPNEGPRACNTAAVVLLGIRLYRITGDSKYLDASKVMADAILKRFYTYKGGFGEISYWGGNYSVEMLCEMYETDRDMKWYYAAKDICDFLIGQSRDKQGYYPDGPNNPGYWNIVRTNASPAANVEMMSQACAANALLRFAYMDLHMPLAKGIYKITNASTGKALSVKEPVALNKGEVTTSDFMGKNSQKWYLNVDNEGIYTIKSTENNIAIAVENCVYNTNSRLNLDPDAGTDCKKFRVENAGNGQFRIIHIQGKAMDAGTTNQNDDFVYLSDRADVDNQKWVLERQETRVSWVTLTKDTTITTSNGAVLSVNASGADGTINKVEYYTNGVLAYTSKTAPYTYNWRPKTSGITEVNAVAYDKSGDIGYSPDINVTVLCIEPGTYSMINAGNNKNLGIVSSRPDLNDAEVVTSAYLAMDFQHWNVSVDNLGFYSFAPVRTNYKIGMADCVAANNTQLKQKSSASGDCQKFYMVDLGLNQYQICAKNTTKAIAAAVSTNNDVPVYLWEKATVNNQKWKFSSVVTGILNPAYQQNITVYPNPVGNTLNISFPFDVTGMELFNLAGQKILQTDRQHADVSGLSPGIYILVLKDGSNLYKTKIVKE